MEQAYFQVAKEAVYKAAKVIKDSFYMEKKVNEKSRKELVTEIDKLSEDIIIDHIRQSFPDHEFLGEESQDASGNPLINTQFQGYRWIIDPIDGTTNFVHKVPWISISLALQYQKELIVGLIHNPINGDFFYAIKGQGAYYQEDPIAVSQTRHPEDCLMVTGFLRVDDSLLEKSVTQLKWSVFNTRGIRRLGSAALDLAYVAWGRFDCFYEYNLKPWDVAAGVIIVREAGGVIKGLDGQPFDLYKPHVLASNFHLADEFYKNLVV